MSWFRTSKFEKFIDQNADGLVQNLAHFCATGAKDVSDSLGERLPHNLDTDIIVLFLFSLRGTIDALGVKNKFGKHAFNTIVRALDKLYEAAFPQAYCSTGTFSKSLMKDVGLSISESSNPNEWIRIHSIRSLETKDPDDELFHLALAKVLTSGESILAAVDRAS
jgi:hypothetical protein